MGTVRLMRLVAGSALACSVILLASLLWVGAQRGSGPSLRPGLAVGLSLATGLVFAVLLLCVYFPVLTSLRQVLDRGRAAVGYSMAGALLFPIPVAVVVFLWRDSDDPTNLWGYLQHWSRVPGEAVLAAVPFIVAGAIFGRGLARAD